jgi:hypothetical protein
MTRKQALIELRDKVKAGGDTLGEVLDIERELNVKPLGGHVTTFWKAAHGSLDAAKVLHDAVLPGWTASIGQNAHHHNWSAWVRLVEGGIISKEFILGEATPARAWLLAILDALISQEPDT